MRYTTGKQVDLGVYECKRCNSAVAIDTLQETLPICPNCNHKEFTKVEKSGHTNK